MELGFNAHVHIINRLIYRDIELQSYLLQDGSCTARAGTGFD